jgi:hypothetical protein
MGFGLWGAFLHASSAEPRYFSPLKTSWDFLVFLAQSKANFSVVRDELFWKKPLDLIDRSRLI